MFHLYVYALYNNFSYIITVQRLFSSDYVFSSTTFFKKKFKVRFFKIDPTSVEQHKKVFFKVQQKER